ncbi:RNA dependent RNA polymerase-domain-containing protein [Trametes meyenii]|nr:RNA dependent RNA polymerase-domain-containing protein [Trametes meyenii]
MNKLQDDALLGPLDNGQDIDIIPRCESSLSNASKSSNYTEELGGEDLTHSISLILDEDLESLNSRLPHTIGVSRKREYDFSFDVDNEPPRQRLKYTHPPNGFSSLPSTHDSSASTPHPQWQSPEPIIVGASQAVQKYTNRLPWGTLWELARLIATGLDPSALDIILKELLELRSRTAASIEGPSSNADTAPRVAKIAQRLRKVGHVESGISDEFSAVYARENLTKLPWDELDEEEKILGRDPLGGVGGNCAGAYSKQEHDWYGGNVNFTAHLNRCKHSDALRLTLERPVLGPSNRFARRFGSRRFIRVRVASELVYSQPSGELAAFFKRPLVIGSATFRAFFAKEYSVFFFRTREELVWSEKHGPTVRSLPLTSSRARQEHSLLEFLRWHNDMNFNYEQTMVKWAARFALGLSNSVPSLRLQSTNIIFMEDIICEAFIGAGKPPSEMQMTDGCGLANRRLMRAVQAKLGWQDEPPAIQMRIGGAKGLLLVFHGLPPVWRSVCIYIISSARGTLHSAPPRLPSLTRLDLLIPYPAH